MNVAQSQFFYMLTSNYVPQYESEDSGCVAAAGFIDGCAKRAVLDEALLWSADMHNILRVFSSMQIAELSTY